jgi:hypothetical protein
VPRTHPGPPTERPSPRPARPARPTHPGTPSHSLAFAEAGGYPDASVNVRARYGLVVAAVLVAGAWFPLAAPVAQGKPVAAAEPRDVVAVTGSGGVWQNVNITASSGPLGQDAHGQIRFTFATVAYAEPVRCLRVYGPDRGVGTPSAPTVAILNTTIRGLGGVITVKLVDRGDGRVIMSGQALGRALGDCSPAGDLLLPTELAGGPSSVFDAP